MSASLIHQLVEILPRQPWQWERIPIRHILDNLGWEFIEEVGSRWEYKVAEGVQASLYFHREVCQLIEVVLNWFDNVEQLNDVQYEDKVDEFFHKFEVTVDIVSKVLGKPVFNNGSAAKGFPKDQDAEWLALWNFPTCRFMVQEKHEEREAPFRVSLVMAPAA